MSNIVKLEDKIDRCVQALVRKFAECAKNDVSVNLTEWIQWCEQDSLDRRQAVLTPHIGTHSTSWGSYFSAVRLAS